MSFRELWNQWQSFWFAPDSPLPICVFRILFGIVLIIYCTLLYPDLLSWFGTRGICSFETSLQVLAPLGPPGINIRPWMPPGDTGILVLYWLLVLSTLTLTLGLFTRFSALCVFLVLASFQQQNSLIINGGDIFLKICSFYLIFAPAGYCLSLDRMLNKKSKLDPRQRVASFPAGWPQRLLRFHVALVYFQAFWSKLADASWLDGTAIYYVLRESEFLRYPMPWISNSLWMCQTLTWGTLFVECAMWSLVWFKETRYIALGGALLLHLGIEYTMNLPTFESIMIASLIVFVPSKDLKKAWNILTKPSTEASTQGHAKSPMVSGTALLLLISSSASLGLLITSPASLAETASLTGSIPDRTTHTHVIDELPLFDIPEDETPTRTVEKAAQRQIENSINTDTKMEPHLGSGNVIVTTKQKQDASKESTTIGRDSLEDERQVPEVRRPTIALAFGGGGARGAAHIGVLRVLKDAGVPIDYIVGNSMGSIVGGLYASGVSLDEIEKIVTDGSLRKAYMPGMLPPKLLLSPIEKLMHPFRKHYAGLWTGKKFNEFLERQLPKGVQNVEDTPIPFSAVATNLIDGKAYRISDGKLSTAIRASSTIPTLLQPVAIGDRVYVDGGVRANLPASAARDTGADIVIAVLVDEPLRKLPATQFQHLSGIIERLSDVMLAVADARQLPFADIIINPDVSGLPVINGSVEDVGKAILAGEVAARKALPEITKRRKAVAVLSAKKSREQGEWNVRKQ
jgi:predicted acylesterase/phospholipase RssA